MRRLERPHKKLAVYYVLFALLFGPLFPFIVVPMMFRYRTLRYRFDEEGIQVRYGVLFRKETSLTYERIQDIHLASNVIERHLGLGRVLIQTASASKGAEMTIEGFLEFESIRDFLYARMRGASDQSNEAPQPSVSEADPAHAVLPDSAESELTRVIEELVVEVQKLRDQLRNRTP